MQLFLITHLFLAYYFAPPYSPFLQYILRVRDTGVSPRASGAAPTRDWPHCNRTRLGGDARASARRVVVPATARDPIRRPQARRRRASCTVRADTLLSLYRYGRLYDCTPRLVVHKGPSIGIPASRAPHIYSRPKHALNVDLPVNTSRATFQHGSRLCRLCRRATSLDLFALLLLLPPLLLLPLALLGRRVTAAAAAAAAAAGL